MKIVRNIVKIDEEKCDGCGICIPACAEGAIRLEDGKARLIADRYCDGLGACLGECPRDAISIVEREAAEFDEKAVKDLLKIQPSPRGSAGMTMECGCPSTEINTFASHGTAGVAKARAIGEAGFSELTHWPVKIRLVPPGASFLENADLLVAADCTPLACGNFHRDFLKGRAVLTGCPKFEDVDSHIQKFTDIFRESSVRSVTVLVMEVPCCHGLPRIVRTAMENAGKAIPLDIMIISRQGEINPDNTL
ncbi:MAG: 4Fe-4S binding protein [Syntrophales bacterium]|nr:4Fe-4S binding protein [Syntrophales bacterium]